MNVHRSWLLGLIALSCACSKRQPIQRSAAEDATPRAGTAHATPAPQAPAAVATGEQPSSEVQGSALPAAPPEPGEAHPAPRNEQGSGPAAAEGRAEPTQAAPATATEGDTSRVRAAFRARPGRRLVGHAALRSKGGETTLTVDVRDAPSELARVRLYQAESCAPFGAGAGRFSSHEHGTPRDIDKVGELHLADGQGADAYRMPARSKVDADKRAIVAFAPVDAHGGEVSEPIACAELPRS